MGTTKVVIIDKQSLFRVGVMQAFIELPDLKIVRASPDERCIDDYRGRITDVILLDIDAPSLNGLKMG